MAKMLKRHGQEVVLYGSAGTDAPCDELVEIVGPETLRTEHRADDIASVATGSGALQIGLQTPSSRRSTSDDPSPATLNWQQHADRPAWIEHRARGCLELKRRHRPGDVGLISCGAFQGFVAEECWAATEFIAGYAGVFHWSRVFPSAAWMHYQYGRLKQQSGLQTWDAVVPHFLDPSDFPFDPRRKPAGYLLFLGRLSQAKGVDLAMQIARASGLPLVVAGQAESGPQVPDWLSGLAAKMGSGVRWVGPVDHARRCELLAGAVALVNPVRWVEPFGMVNIESLAMGCPVIGPPFGSFPEILEPRVTGMLCRDLEEYVAAVDWAKRADRSACRAAAERRFSLDAVWPQYERHFQKIAKVGTKAGWSVRGQWPRGVAEGGEPLPPPWRCVNKTRIVCRALGACHLSWGRRARRQKRSGSGRGTCSRYWPRE